LPPFSTISRAILFIAILFPFPILALQCGALT